MTTRKRSREDNSVGDTKQRLTANKKRPRTTLSVQKTSRSTIIEPPKDNEEERVDSSSSESNSEEEESEEVTTEAESSSSSSEENTDEVAIFEGLKRSPSATYELHEKIGKGAFGSVYRATDKKTGREVAIKKIQFVVDTGLSQMQELNILQVIGDRCLPHHIVCVLDHFTWTKSGKHLLYIVMEYIPGKDVRVFNAMKPTEREQLDMATQLFEALQFIHGLGINHRDIKPDNIMWHNGKLTLVDFGLACRVPKCRGRQDGTRRYTWPGLFGAKQVTQDMFRVTDLYAASKVVFELLDARVRSTPKLEQLADIMRDVVRQPQNFTAQSVLFKIKSL